MHAGCRLCGAGVERAFADLGMTPLANAFLTEDQLDMMEPFYPLRALVCEECLMVQLKEYQAPASIFSEYAYFSSFSSSWQEHCRRFAEHAIERFDLGGDSRVVEVASNDGCLLEKFAERGVRAEGIEPATNVAAAAQERGLPTVVDFFGARLARALAAVRPADLIVANNVVPHTPVLNDFLSGLKLLLAPGGTVTVEFQHLLRLIVDVEFDTIYHEHFSYFTLGTFRAALEAHGLKVSDVERIPTHGGSLRAYVSHAEEDRPIAGEVEAVLDGERAEGLETIEGYVGFDERVKAAKREIVSFLLGLKDTGLSVAGYGAPAKGNTLLNYCGIGSDVIDFTVDRNPRKQGRFLPGSHIPVLPPSAIDERRPDVVFILSWNLRDEVMDQLSHVRGWGGRFAARSPELRLWE